MKFIKKLFFILIFSKFIKTEKNIAYNNLNFKKLDFTNYKQIKSFIFKKNFYELDNKYIHGFEFLNFSQNLGGKMGITLSKDSIINWFYLNKNQFGLSWSGDYVSKRLINIIYNYEFINSSSTFIEKKILNKIILLHMHRCIFDFKNKQNIEISSYDLIASTLSFLILNKKIDKYINYINLIVSMQIDSLGMHKSYNVLEHAKFINNIYELKSIFLYFNKSVPSKIEESLLKMNSVLNEYFHVDGSMPLFNGSNNNYTKIIYESLNKEEYLKSRSFSNTKNGLAFYSDKNKKLFFDVVQPNKNQISSNLNAGTLSFEFSCFGEKIVTNCGASESLGKNPEYLKYSAAHSTIILQNTNISEIKENNPHIKYPQSVTFEKNIINKNVILEGSHNGYQNKFNKIIKRKLEIVCGKNKLLGEDSILSNKLITKRLIYHIRFHLDPYITYNFTNSKKNLILKTKLKNMWLFKSDVELNVEDSILVDNNVTLPTKQIVIKGVISDNKQIRKWSLEKI